MPVAQPFSPYGASPVFVGTSDRILYGRENPVNSPDVRTFSLPTGKDLRILSIPVKLFLEIPRYSQFRVKSNMMLVENFQ